MVDSDGGWESMWETNTAIAAFLNECRSCIATEKRRMNQGKLKRIDQGTKISCIALKSNCVETSRLPWESREAFLVFSQTHNGLRQLKLS